MDVTIYPGALSGSVRAIPSKSDVHRLLIAAALSDGESSLPWDNPSADMRATLRCLVALGARAEVKDGVCRIIPGKERPRSAVLDCGESGSTLRFLMPVAAALGVSACFIGQARLPYRPQGPLLDALRANGCNSNGDGLPMRLKGALRAGEYRLPGGVSSQFISGLLFALPLLDGDSRISLSSSLESAPYVDMTLSTLRRFGVSVEVTEEGYFVPGNQQYKSPGRVVPQGDWSSAAFWLCAGALNGDVTVKGMNVSSPQGDKAVMDALAKMGASIEIDGQNVRSRGKSLKGAQIDIRQTPDLGPVLALTAAHAQGETEMSGVKRLRIKESDRLAVVIHALLALGMQSSTDGETLFVPGGGLNGGSCDGFQDHRIVMSLAVAATACKQAVTIRGAEAISKSYPDFFRDFERLGGKLTWHP